MGKWRNSERTVNKQWWKIAGSRGRMADGGCAWPADKVFLNWGNKPKKSVAP